MSLYKLSLKPILYYWWCYAWIVYSRIIFQMLFSWWNELFTYVLYLKSIIDWRKGYTWIEILIYLKWAIYLCFMLAKYYGSKQKKFQDDACFINCEVICIKNFGYAYVFLISLWKWKSFLIVDYCTINWTPCGDITCIT